MWWCCFVGMPSESDINFRVSVVGRGTLITESLQGYYSHTYSWLPVGIVS